MAHLAKTIKKNPALVMPDDTKVNITVGKMTAMLRSFYDAGRGDSDQASSVFDKVFGKRGGPFR